MPTRAEFVAKALSFNGELNGAGYNCDNPHSRALGRPVEAWCADFFTDILRQCGAPLPSMQVGCKQGFCGVSAGWDFAIKQKATRSSWQAEPGDAAIFDWNADGNIHDGICHIEMVETWSNGVLHTIGGNSGGSNVDGFNKEGGVHRHTWPAPVGTGNSLILGIIDIAKIVKLGAKPVKPDATTAISHDGPKDTAQRDLILKTPHLTGDDVKRVQQALVRNGAKLDVDGEFGQLTGSAVIAFQKAHHLEVDGTVGAITRKALGI